MLSQVCKAMEQKSKKTTKTLAPYLEDDPWSVLFVCSFHEEIIQSKPATSMIP